MAGEDDDPQAPLAKERAADKLDGRRLAETRIAPRQPADAPPDSEGEAREREFLRRFTPAQVIAVGGMGELRRYHDGFLDRDVVVKAIRADQRAHEASQRRFVREARIQAGLTHPCIVPVYDVGNLDRRDVFFTMAHIGGRTLHEILTGLRGGQPAFTRSFSRRQLLDAFLRVCLAVAYAHERGVVHRDLKPENVMLGDYGEVYILDWGVAKREERRDRRSSGVSLRRDDDLFDLPKAELDEEEEGSPETLTASGSTLGTLEYMAPEQYLGSQRLDERSDVYSLGAILYEILGDAWFREAPSRGELVRLVWRETHRPLERATPGGAAAGMDAIWRKATATKPAERFQSARELHDALVRHLDGEREVQRAREAALEHARDAAREIEKAGESPAEAEERRGRALRSLGRALAADPSQAAALETLVNDLLAHPADAAPEVQAEMLAAERVGAFRSFQLSMLVFAAWFGFLLLGHLFMGVLDRAAMASMGAVVIALFGYNFWAWYAGRYERRHMVAMMLLSFASISITSSFLGPFVLLPSLATTMFAAFAVTMRGDERVRTMAMALSVGAVMVPATLQVAGVLPASYLFEGGNIVIVPRLVALPPHLAPLVIMSIALVSVLFANVRTAQVIGELTRSERAALTQAYRLRQLLPSKSSLEPGRST